VNDGDETTLDGTLQARITPIQPDFQFAVAASSDLGIENVRCREEDGEEDGENPEFGCLASARFVKDVPSNVGGRGVLRGCHDVWSEAGLRMAARRILCHQPERRVAAKRILFVAVFNVGIEVMALLPNQPLRESPNSAPGRPSSRLRTFPDQPNRLNPPARAQQIAFARTLNELNSDEDYQ
jgi:hypothetical protein